LLIKTGNNQRLKGFTVVNNLKELIMKSISMLEKRITFAIDRNQTKIND